MERARRFAVVSAAVLGGVLLLFLFFRYAAGILLPFAAGALVAAAARRPADALAAKWRCRRAIPRVGIAVLAGALLSLLAAFAVRRLGRELLQLGAFVAEGGVAGVLDALHEWQARLPALARLFPDAEALLSSAARQIAEEILRLVPGAFAAAVTAVPDGVFSLAVFVFAAFYFCRDGERISAALLRLLPAQHRAFALSLRARLGETLRAYLGVYACTAALNFSLLLAGFLLLRVKYAWMLAGAFSLLDLLPVVGVGTFLLPWAAACFVTGDPLRGAGLLVLYVAALVVRRLAEGKWLGRRLGMHPLFALLFLFGGYRLFGIAGMLLAPPAAALCGSLLAAGEGKAKAPPRTVGL